MTISQKKLNTFPTLGCTINARNTTMDMKECCFKYHVHISFHLVKTGDNARNWHAYWRLKMCMFTPHFTYFNKVEYGINIEIRIFYFVAFRTSSCAVMPASSTESISVKV